MKINNIGVFILIFGIGLADGLKAAQPSVAFHVSPNFSNARSDFKSMALGYDVGPSARWQINSTYAFITGCHFSLKGFVYGPQLFSDSSGIYAEMDDYMYFWFLEIPLLIQERNTQDTFLEIGIIPQILIAYYMQLKGDFSEIDKRYPGHQFGDYRVIYAWDLAGDFISKYNLAVTIRYGKDLYSWRNVVFCTAGNAKLALFPVFSESFWSTPAHLYSIGLDIAVRWPADN